MNRAVVPCSETLPATGAPAASRTVSVAAPMLAGSIASLNSALTAALRERTGAGPGVVACTVGATVSLRLPPTP